MEMKHCRMRKYFISPETVGDSLLRMGRLVVELVAGGGGSSGHDGDDGELEGDSDSEGDEAGEVAVGS